MRHYRWPFGRMKLELVSKTVGVKTKMKFAWYEM
nr:MAG TPA: hypothetical protein [Caudoviricetes sp.]